MSQPDAANVAGDSVGAGDENEDRRTKHLKKCATGIIVGAAFYPLQLSKTLIQLGYEPARLTRGKILWLIGRETYFLPNGFAYARNLYQKNGFFSLYRGLAPCLCGNVAGSLASLAALEWIDEKAPPALPVPADHQILDDVPFADQEMAALKRSIRECCRDSFARSAGVIAARPFQVIMVRTVAQTIGNEKIYNGIIPSISYIWTNEGLNGFFVGLMPQLAHELLLLWSNRLLCHTVDRLWLYASRDMPQDQQTQEAIGPLKKMLKMLIPYIVNSIFYPLQLVSTIMAVNGCPELVVGKRPYIPVFTTWSDCYNYLYSINQTKRGAKLFLRQYDGPVVYVGGYPYAQMSGKFLN